MSLGLSRLPATPQPEPPPPTQPRPFATRRSPHATTIRTPYQSTLGGSPGSECSPATPSGSTWTPSPSSTPSVPDSLAGLFRLLGTGSELRAMEARAFLRSLGLRGRDDLRYFSLKTFLDSSGTAGDERSRECSPRLMTFGMMQSGSVLTARIGYRRRARASSSSDVLVSPGSIPPRYFLSERAVRSVLAHSARHAGLGHGFTARIVPGPAWSSERSTRTTPSGEDPAP